MSAKERGRANGKVSTLAGHRGTPAGSEMNAINSFTVIEECAIELAVLTLRYRRARHYLIARQIEQALSDDVVLDPYFTEQRKSFSEASRELRREFCYLAINLTENEGCVLRDLVGALSIENHAGSAEQFGDIAAVFADWHACQRLLDCGETIQSADFTIPSDAKLDTINANLAMLLASLRDHLKRLGFDLPRG